MNTDTDAGPKKIKTGRNTIYLICAISTLIALAFPPLISYFLLLSNFDSYRFNRILSLDEAQLVFWNFVIGKAVFIIPAFGVLFVVLSRRYMKRQFSTLQVYVTQTIVVGMFIIPYCFMALVLPFDILERDFETPGVYTTYSNYFILLAPLIGSIFALIGWFFSKVFFLKHRKD